MHLQKLENFLFLQVESCNLVNTFSANLEQAMGKKKKKKHSSFGLTKIVHFGINF